MPMLSFHDVRRVALIAGTLAAAASAGAAPAKRDVRRAPGDRAGTIVIPAGKLGTVSIPVTVDRARIDTSGVTNARLIKVVGKRGDRIVEVLDAYPSRPQGLARCQAGNETYFRVLDTVARKQLFARLVDSCVDDRVQAADPLITRSAGGGEVTLHGLYSSFTVRIGADGTVAVVP